MKQFKSEQEHIEFLKPICARYRQFIKTYLGITRTQLIELTSKQLKIPQEDCHINNIKTIEQMSTIIQFYKRMCQALIGKKNLPKKGGMSTLARKYIRGEINGD